MISEWFLLKQNRHPLLMTAPYSHLLEKCLLVKSSALGHLLELHSNYVAYGGSLTRKQMFTKLIAYLGNDVVVLSIQDCAFVVGFQEFV